MNLIPLTGDSTAALMGSGKISGFQRERERLINVHSAPNSSSDTPLFTHLHSQTHSQFICAVRPHQLHFASQQCAAESHLFVSQAQGGENSLTPLFGAWEGHMTTKWWRLSAVGKPSIPDAERYRHTSMIWNPGQEIELQPQPWWWVHCGWLYQACCYLKPWELGWEGKREEWAFVCDASVFDNGRGLASASFMMQDMGSCFWLCMDHKWMFVMFNTNTFYRNVGSAYKHCWPAFSIIQIHGSACTAHLFAYVCVWLCVCKCKCVWTLKRKSDSQRRGEREQGRWWWWWWWHNARPLFPFPTVEDGWIDGLSQRLDGGREQQTFPLSPSPTLILSQHTFSVWELATIWQLIVDRQSREIGFPFHMAVCVYAYIYTWIHAASKFQIGTVKGWYGLIFF